MDVEQRQAGGSVIRLRANSVGLIGLATLGAVMMSPALGIYGNWGPMAHRRAANAARLPRRAGRIAADRDQLRAGE